MQNAPTFKQVLILLLLLINYQHSHVLYNLGDNMDAKISYRYTCKQLSYITLVISHFRHLCTCAGFSS